jgi:adenosine 3'-phospho 5'-phosphosulfate transporter B2
MNLVPYLVSHFGAICVGCFLATSVRAVSAAVLDVQADSSIWRALRFDQIAEPIGSSVVGGVDLTGSSPGSKSNDDIALTASRAAYRHSSRFTDDRNIAAGRFPAGSMPGMDVASIKTASASIANGMMHGQLDTDPDSSNQTLQKDNRTGVGGSHDGKGRNRKIKPHNVEHVEELNKDILWYLMAVCICSIGMLCMHLESLTIQASTNRVTVESKFGSWRQLFKLAICAVGLNTSMLFWGIAQEFMMTNLYVDDEGNEERLGNVMSLVISNRLMTVFACGGMLFVQGTKIIMPPLEVCLPAGTNLLASWFQYQSLAYVSFPLQTVAKSAKLLPVMVISSFRGKTHTSLEYAEAILIVSSVVVFGLESERSSITSDSSVTQLGMLLLASLLIFDSVTPHLQDVIFSGTVQMSPLEVTFYMASFAACLAFTQILCTGALLPSISFFMRHRRAILHLVVLSLCSTTTQFLISYTIKNFGPVAFSVIATTRQLISVLVSFLLFKHELSGVAWFAASIVFVTLLWRTVRPSMKQQTRESFGRDEGVVDERGASALTPASNDRLVVDALSGRPMEIAFLTCVVGMHVPMMFYSVVQEFLATHTFDGDLFRYPLFLIAMNRTGATLFASVMLRAQGIVIFDGSLLVTLIPAGVNLIATFCQYQALYYIVYPAQILMKTIKVIPVMLAGQVLRNRSYSCTDYMEAAMITGLVCFFMWNYSTEMGRPGNLGTTAGVILMLAYVVADSFTSNVEDLIYQSKRLDPAQLLLGMQATSGLIAWIWLLGSGQLLSAVAFLFKHNSAIIHILVLVLAETCGSYACTLTVKMFGPAVFTLLLIAHQIESFIISVYLFNHPIKDMSCVCVAIVCFLILSSSMRRVNAQSTRSAKDEKHEAERGSRKSLCEDAPGKA